MPNKLQKFADIERFENCFSFFFEQIKDGFAIKGKWREEFFKNENPLILELGCGRGEYTVGLGQANRNKNYVGIDVKGNRIWTGANFALENKLTNIAFIRTRIDFIEHCFGEAEVDEIWITFPDPQLRLSKAKKRLTHPKFLRLYQQILSPGGLIHLKTDSPDLYRFTKLVTEMYQCPVHTDNDHVFANENVSAELAIKTHYESLDIAGSNRVHYLCFSLPVSLGDREKDGLLKEKLIAHEPAD